MPRLQWPALPGLLVSVSWRGAGSNSLSETDLGSVILLYIPALRHQPTTYDWNAFYFSDFGITKILCPSITLKAFYQSNIRTWLWIR